MRCSACATDNPDGMKFCGNCAAPLGSRCPKCGFDNPRGFKFCGQCSAPLGAAAAPPAARAEVAKVPDGGAGASHGAEERKTVTALFADIKGSMELIEGLDPEEARAIIDPALRLMIDAVHRYDGHIVQSTGDGVFAMFGAPVAHEDHPQRALLAGLRMQEEMTRYSARLRENGNPPVEIRVGVNTGEVVIRAIRTGDGSAEYTPIGHSTSLAARMQALAPSGSIVVTGDTQKLAAGYFEFKQLGPARIKGVTDPVEVFEVAGLGPLRTRLQRSASRGLVRFVGRKAEMDQMRHAAELARAGHGQIVAAVAEAGVGKSRLFHEFKLQAPPAWMVMETFSVSHGKASPYLPVVELLKGYFSIADRDEERPRREKITGRVLALDRSLEDTLPHFFALLGVRGLGAEFEEMDPQIRRQRSREAVKRLLLRESINQPLMLIVEDLHWIDAESEELLAMLAESIATARILLLVNYRPEYRHDWGSKSYYTQLRLDPLGPESAGEMLDAMLGSGGELDGLKRMVVARTEGNPFFIEEIVQSLLEQGALARNGTVRLVRPLETIQIPLTVKAILAARIDKLGAAEKDLLQTLAVIGKEFPLGLVRRVSGRADSELDPLLRALQVGEFIYEQPAVPDVEFIFKHALTQEVAYDSVLTQRRRQIHERAASALEAMFPDHEGDHAVELANHYSHSANAAKAVEYLRLAADQARMRSAYGDALDYLRKALKMLRSLPETLDRNRIELGLQVAKGTAIVNLRGFSDPEMEPLLARARELSNRIGDTPALVEVLLGTWNLEFTRGLLRQAVSTAERVLALAYETGNHEIIANAHGAVAPTYMWLGRLSEARSHFAKVIEIHDRDIARYLPMAYAPVVPSRCNMAWALWMLGYPDQARDRIDQALDFARQLGRPFSMGFATQNWVAIYNLRRDYAVLRPMIETLIELSREHGLRHWLAGGTMSMGKLLVREGRVDEGMAMLRDGLDLLLKAGAGLVYSYGQALFAETCLEAGRFDEGLRVADAALQLFERSDSKLHEAEVHRLRGEMLLRTPGREGDAEPCFRRALEVARAQEAKSWELRAATSLARVLDGRGERDAARALLAPVYGWFTEGRSTQDHLDAAALLAKLAG
jgi:class 3 adenylate cyclase/tetratricopeptide (TPR) repeat protein